MKVATARANNIPVLGSRSPRYFGVSLYMDQSFFNKTSHCKHGKPTPDPRIKGFCRTTQNRLRDRINSAALKFGFTLDDANNEWQAIVKMATKAATAKMTETSLGLSPDNAITKSAGGPKIKDAFKAACRVAAGIVHERESDRDSWEFADCQQHLGFIGEETFIYIFRDGPQSRFYKIGKTNDLGRRISEYKTHSREFVVIQSYPARRGLSEALIHQYFASKRDEREFFILSEDDVELVSNPVKMAEAIRQRQLQ
jgi:predicted GIY-YIG superfamily endonuclease